MIHVATRRELSSPLSEVLLTIGLAFILILGGLAVLQGELLSSVFVLFVILFARLVPPVQSIVRVYNNLQKANAAAVRIFEIMDADETIIEKDHPVVLDGFTSTIEYRDVSFAYRTGPDTDPVYVLRNINLTIPCGQTIAIVGPSGAGKTTVLNILGGMDTLTDGKVVVDGMDISRLKGRQMAAYRRENVGFVFQFYNLMQNLTALENVELAMQICKSPMDPGKVLEEVGLLERKNNFPAQLSGGEQQRVAIARALAKNPKLLLCDEPTGALDYVTGKAILKLLQDMCRNRGMTVVVITHNSALTPMADRVIKIKNGRVSSMKLNPAPVPVEEIEW
jgi:putative ABC transport system ATP-binding protein